MKFHIGEVMKDAFGIAHCGKCGAMGTIVDIGACCRIAEMREENDSSLLQNEKDYPGSETGKRRGDDSPYSR